MFALNFHLVKFVVSSLTFNPVILLMIILKAKVNGSINSSACAYLVYALTIIFSSC